MAWKTTQWFKIHRNHGRRGSFHLACESEKTEVSSWWLGAWRSCSFWRLLRIFSLQEIHEETSTVWSNDINRYQTIVTSDFTPSHFFLCSTLVNLSFIPQTDRLINVMPNSTSSFFSRILYQTSVSVRIPKLFKLFSLWLVTFFRFPGPPSISTASFSWWCRDSWLSWGAFRLIFSNLTTGKPKAGRGWLGFLLRFREVQVKGVFS